MKKRFSIIEALALVTAAIALVVVLYNPNHSQRESNEQTVLTDNQIPVAPVSFAPTEDAEEFVDAAEKSLNAVVHIRTEIVKQSTSYEDFFGALLGQLYGNGTFQMPENRLIGFGSGVVLSADGYIVTNNHVVEGADKVEVTFNDKHKKSATVIGTDPKTDLALIKVDDTNLEYLVFGDSDKVRIGQWVLAVGNPFNLTSTVTAGIVSAKARNINILGDNSTIESFIQTDAVVNKGNSGGALVDTEGKLIGINAAIASHTGVYEGYSFAIPSNIVKKVVSDIMTYGSTRRAYLGIEMREMTEEFASEKGIDMTQGVYVTNVQDKSGAKKAGIKEGDIIVEANNQKITSSSELLGVIIQFNPGDKLKVKLNRNGKTVSKEIELTDEFGASSYTQGGEKFTNDDLGVVLEPLSAKDRKTYNVSGGLKVIEVKKGIMNRAGINTGFVITKINGMAVNSKESLDSAVDNSKHGKTSVEGIYENGMRMSFEFYD